MEDQLTAAFKEVMAHVAAPVTIVATQVDGVPFGTTVSAFASLSITPCMVVLALDNRGTMVDRLREAGRMGINILAPDQAEIAQRFASKIPDRFAPIDWSLSDGVPQLAGVTAFLHCSRIDFAPGGDHTIVIGTVSRAETYGNDTLTYFRRTFGSALHGTDPTPVSDWRP